MNAKQILARHFPPNPNPTKCRPNRITTKSNPTANEIESFQNGANTEYLVESEPLLLTMQFIDEVAPVQNPRYFHRRRSCTSRLMAERAYTSSTPRLMGEHASVAYGLTDGLSYIAPMASWNVLPMAFRDSCIGKTRWFCTGRECAIIMMI